MQLLGIPEPPPGDPVRLRAAADLWMRAADSIDEATSQARARVQTVATTWTGPARTAFDQQWDPMISAAGEAGEELRRVARTLFDVADGIESAQRAYEVAVGASILTAVVGSVAAVATLGASEVVALEAAIAELLIAVGIAEEAAVIAAGAFGLAAQALRQIVIHFTIDLVGQAGMSTIVYPDHNPIGHLDFGEAAQTALDQVSEPEVRRPHTSGRRLHAEGSADASGAGAGDTPGVDAPPEAA